MPAILCSTAVLSPDGNAKFRLIAATLPSLEINQSRNKGSSRMRRAAASSSTPSLLSSGETSSRPAVQRGSTVDIGLSMTAILGNPRANRTASASTSKAGMLSTPFSLPTVMPPFGAIARKTVCATLKLCSRLSRAVRSGLSWLKNTRLSLVKERDGTPAALARIAAKQASTSQSRARGINSENFIRREKKCDER